LNQSERNRTQWNVLSPSNNNQSIYSLESLGVWKEDLSWTLFTTKAKVLNSGGLIAEFSNLMSKQMVKRLETRNTQSQQEQAQQIQSQQEYIPLPPSQIRYTQEEESTSQSITQVTQPMTQYVTVNGRISFLSDCSASDD
jgi:hypothetical protein